LTLGDIGRLTVPSILVLDDEPLISMMLEEWLTEFGCKTIGPVQTVQGALDLIVNPSPDGAILDLSLRNENCYPVADVLRDRGIRFAFATGHDAHIIENRFHNELILSKPFDFESVRYVIAHLLDEPSRNDNQRSGYFIENKGAERSGNASFSGR
jgi:DNA-binding response OmpR family regulator